MTKKKKEKWRHGKALIITMTRVCERRRKKEKRKMIESRKKERKSRSGCELQIIAAGSFVNGSVRPELLESKRN